MRRYRPDYRQRRNWRPRTQSSFASEVVGASLFFGAIVFVMAPQISSTWNSATKTPEELQASERSVYYRNCDAARAAGAAPIYRGEPGYRPEMDGDSDGIACEPYR